MFAATLAATCGNMLYHFFRDIGFVFTLGPWKAIAGFRVYALYTLALGCGIGISQLRSSRTGLNRNWLSRVLAATRVIGFFWATEIARRAGADHFPGREISIRFHRPPLRPGSHRFRRSGYGLAC